MKQEIEIYSDDTPLMGPGSPEHAVSIEDLIKYLATVKHRFGNTRVKHSIQWGSLALSKFSRYQQRVERWMEKCFGEEISNDTTERNHRFLEESLELVQACGCTASEAHQLVDYVFNRPVGEKYQEVGGVRVTLAALCLAHDIGEDEAAVDELERIWTKVEEIREKQEAKPRHSPLPA